MKKFSAFLIILMVLPTVLPLFSSRFFYTQDYIFVARQQQMNTVLSNFIFPARWAPDLRFGEPIFNFYASLPFYVGSLISLLGFNVIWTVKMLFVLSSILSALTMYLLCRKLFSKPAAFLGAVLYTYAPYRAVDLYVRGAISEAWAFVFFPLIFYASVLVSGKKSLKNICLLSLSLSGLFLTHNVTTLMFLPFLALWWIYLMIRQKDWKVSIALIISSLWGVSLAAFFLLPAFLERGFIQTKYLVVGYFNFRSHFVAVRQFFSIFWGYGSSVWGPEDGMSFQVGLVNWIILILAVVAVFLSRKEKKLLLLLSFLGAGFLLSIFLQHNKSAFVWESISLMAFIQFPWRFLAFSIFLVSIIGAAITDYLSVKSKIVVFILMGAAILSTIGYFKPKEYTGDSFFDKFIKVDIMHQGTDLTKDYLPIWVQNSDTKYFDNLRAEKDKMEVLSFKKSPVSLDAQIKVASVSAIKAPISYFPGWEVWANGKLISQSPLDEDGLIGFTLSPGAYNIRIDFKDTPVRLMGNLLSFGALLLMVGLGLKRLILK